MEMNMKVVLVKWYLESSKLFILFRIATFKHALKKSNAAKVFQQNAFKIKYQLSVHKKERLM